MSRYQSNYGDTH
jgi:hypothetical protein